MEIYLKHIQQVFIVKKITWVKIEKHKPCSDHKLYMT